MALEDEIAVKHSLVRHGEVSDEPVESVARRRENLNDMRKRCGMLPATFHYQDPTPEMLTHPLWNAIWDEIKPWDIHVPSEYSGYCGATGNHVTAIFLAINDQMERRLESLLSNFDLTELLDKRPKEREEALMASARLDQARSISS